MVNFTNTLKRTKIAQSAYRLRYNIDNSRITVHFRTEGADVLFSKIFILSLMPAQPPIQRIQEEPSAVVKRSRHKTGHSPPLVRRVRINGVIYLCPNTPSQLLQGWLQLSLYRKEECYGLSRISLTLAIAKKNTTPNKRV
jgi:hypothetical protein